MKDFRKLLVWEKSHLLALAVYKTTSLFPKAEIYGLTSQMRRAAVSIPSNIAEGCGRKTEAELSHFMQIAMGSSSELEYQLTLAHDLHYLDDNTFQELEKTLVETRRMLNSFLQKLNKPK